MVIISFLSLTACNYPMIFDQNVGKMVEPQAKTCWDRITEKTAAFRN